ncbi:hypothetical protein ACWDR2_34755 [Streptomyces sp. NPDC003631]
MADRDVETPAVDGGPHGGRPEGGCAAVEVAAYAFGGAAGLLQFQRGVCESDGVVFDVELSAVAVVAGNDFGEALL